MKLIRTLCYAFLPMIFACEIRAQTSADVQRRLGAPVSEVFQVEPGVTATVSYDRQGQVCDVRVEWREAAGTRPGSFFEVGKVAEKLVPESARGRQIGGPRTLIPPLNCCESWAYTYENVVMTNYITGDYHGMKLAFRERQCVAKQPDMHPDMLRPPSDNGK
jgi:hypothetical protein